jgi:hypothetical protein
MHDAQATTSLVPQKRKAYDGTSLAHGHAGSKEVHIVSAPVKKCSDNAAEDDDQAYATTLPVARVIRAASKSSSGRRVTEEFEDPGLMLLKDV